MTDIDTIVLVDFMHLVSAILFFGALIILVYVLARAASFGWYKSKYEHFKKVWKLSHGEQDER